MISEPFEIQITAIAEAESRDTQAWFANYSEEFAERWYVGLLKALKELVFLPTRMPLAEENFSFESMTIRQHLYGSRYNKYRILFTVNEAERVVRILHVRHGSRQRLGRENTADEAE